ncbi:GPI-anchored wall transfer protein 1 [Erysiphe neolycopersici]|uniref:GPI-anchored wall transfer protein n=1 Tax=Erysiphe neolycopersici TaxID=212602 RepID=A0A420I068_9PEZI|nr:GPI-anchored wall transfer protein 1 [Erysiphe neolycopersici]
MSRAAVEQIKAASYKVLKEDFVSNLTGGSISEINYVTAVAPVSVLIWSVLQSRYGFFTPTQRKIKKNAIATTDDSTTTSTVWICTIVEFLINVLSILLATTLYASKPVLLNLLLLAPLLIVVYLLPLPKRVAGTLFSKKRNRKKFLLKPTPDRHRSASGLSSSVNDDKNVDFKALNNPLPKRPFLTTYRGCMLVITCISILAVDFHVFPRRFAKVETWGTSLMDVGVGSFVFSTGIVAARPLLLDQGEAGSSKTMLRGRLLQAGRNSLPLLLLGLIRLWSVKELDYAEHVSEYGVHWNFFFTLGFLPPFVTLFQSAFKYLPSYSILALILGAAYQASLDFTNLKTFILSGPRNNLLSMNREGIFSFVGYLAIFLMGQETGLYVLPRRLLPKCFSAWQQRRRLLLCLGGMSLTWALLFMATTNRIYGLKITVSRRLANLPYIIWIAAFNTSQLTVFCLIETIFFPSVWKLSENATLLEEEEIYQNATSGVLEAYNRNGLAVFLLANLLTGVVNLSISTLYCSDLKSMVILVLYAASISGTAVALNWWDISIKF